MKLKGIMAAAVTVAMVVVHPYTDDDCTGTDFAVKYDSGCRTDG